MTHPGGEQLSGRILKELMAACVAGVADPGGRAALSAGEPADLQRVAAQDAVAREQESAAGSGGQPQLAADERRWRWRPRPGVIWIAAATELAHEGVAAVVGERGH